MGLDVVVIGSVNWDISVLAPRLPRPGETVIGTKHFYGPGGKGANQAVGASRLGAEVAMVGRVGADEYGDRMIARLRAEGVDTTAIEVDDGSATGIAVITIDDQGENTIVGSPGANMRLTPDHIEEKAGLIARASVVLSQFEVPAETVEAAAELTTGTFLFNPAPAQPISSHLFRQIDVLVPNRSELGILAGVREPTSSGEAAALASALDFRGITVVTLGSEGALIVDDTRATLVGSRPVESVDPTGAGDAFCAALAVRLSQGDSITDGVEWATAAGALATTRLGAQTALPTRDEVETLRAG